MDIKNGKGKKIARWFGDEKTLQIKKKGEVTEIKFICDGKLQVKIKNKKEDE